MPLTPEKLVNQDQKLASFPLIYEQLMEALNNPNSKAEDIAEIIMHDASLCVRLLKIVNSSFYNFASQIDTVSRALNVIGTEQLFSLTMGTTIISKFDAIPEKFVTMESFWHHGIACGLAAKSIAKFRKEPNLEFYFIAGMIHDIGSLIIYKQIPELASSALVQCNDWGRPLIKAEQDVMGFDHTQVGKALAEKWQLPESLAQIIAHHHDPDQAEKCKIEASIMHVADNIAEGNFLEVMGKSNHNH
jgi:putative nucleotidyltransferase with HDIG domain